MIYSRSLQPSRFEIFTSMVDQSDFYTGLFDNFCSCHSKILYNSELCQVQVRYLCQFEVVLCNVKTEQTMIIAGNRILLI